LAAFLLLTLMLVGGRRQQPSEPMRVIVESAMFLPVWLVAGQRVTATTFLYLEPAFGAGDAVSFRKEATWKTAQSCCVLLGEYRVGDHTTAIDTARCALRGATEETDYRRIFHKNGAQFTIAEILAWEAGR
jgi:hypothetical protein